MKHPKTILSARDIKTALLVLMLSVFSGAVSAEKINLNLADADTMQYIPGVGQSKADKIIEIRNQAGKFSSMDEIDAVPGIGERTMQDIRKYGSLDSGVSELTEEMKANMPARSASSASEQAEEVSNS